MKLFIAFFSMLTACCIGQPLSYYESVFALDGNELKTQIHEIINDHNELDYETVKAVIRQADQDTSNINNVILLYTGNSISKWNFANNPSSLYQQDYWNREHVWPKSHGDFGPNGIYTDKGANTDAHHLRPVDMTINSLRGYRDFDIGGNVVYNGQVATECKYTSTTWEPRDEVKGDVARMIFYMAARYEGGLSEEGNLEPDLELVNAIGTFPNPSMGRLSILLNWHQSDPVDAWELNRNDVIYNWQGNRNPFIDHPEYVDLIWATADPSLVQISSTAKSPIMPVAGDSILVTANITNPFNSLPEAALYWGNTWEEVLSQENAIIMSNDSGVVYTATIPAQAAETNVYFKIAASNSLLTDTAYASHNFKIAPEPFLGELTSIYAIQGQGDLSPFAAQIVDATGTLYIDSNGEYSVTGVVTAGNGNSFFVQEAGGEWQGIYVYQSDCFPQIGDSVIVTGMVKEYFGLTEIFEISACYLISSGNALPLPNTITTGDIAANSSEAEKFESTIVNIPIANCVAEVQNFGLWKVDDGTGQALIHNTSSYAYEYSELGETYRVSGVLNYTYGEYKVDLRFSEDVGPGMDLIAPYIVSADIFVNGKLSLVFSEAISTTSVENIDNYELNNGVQVVHAEQDLVDSSVVYLWLENLIQDSLQLKVYGCEDLAGNVVLDSTSLYSSFINLTQEEWNLDPIIVHSINGMVYFNSLTEINLRSIWNLVGQVVYSSPDSAKNWVLSLDRGVYVCEVQQGVNRKSIKLIVK